MRERCPIRRGLPDPSWYQSPDLTGRAKIKVRWMPVIHGSSSVNLFCVATNANYDRWEVKGMATKELEAQVVTLERALAERESIDSRYTAMASRIGRIEAAMIWFEEMQDKVKERMDVALEDMPWEKRMVEVLLEKSALCELSPNCHQMMAWW